MKTTKTFYSIYNSVINESQTYIEQFGQSQGRAVIYPGRFQPMLPHHAKVYNRLRAQNPDSEVYIATSDKVEPNESPFNFEEKRSIISQLYNIPQDKILQMKSPYNGDEYSKYFDEYKTILSLAVGEKDMKESPRFKFDNIDPVSKLNMKKRGDGPSYLQPESALLNNPQPLSTAAYIITAPTVTSGGAVASASNFRKELREVNDPEQYLKNMFGDKVKPVMDLIISKITDTNE